MAHPRPFPGFVPALVRAYEEEVAGAAYFTALAGEVHGADGGLLTRLAAMETAMAGALAPLLARHGAVPRPAAVLAAEGRAEAAAEAQGWTAIATGIRDGYGSYVAEFEALRDRADTADRPVLEALIGHETAMIEAAARALAGDPRAAAPVDRFLEALARLKG